MNWYPTRVPPQAGRQVLVTGANAGLGFFTSARLARAGAHVILSGRSPERLDRSAASANSDTSDRTAVSGRSLIR